MLWSTPWITTSATWRMRSSRLFCIWLRYLGALFMAVMRWTQFKITPCSDLEGVCNSSTFLWSTHPITLLIILPLRCWYGLHTHYFCLHSLCHLQMSTLLTSVPFQHFYYHSISAQIVIYLIFIYKAVCSIDRLRLILHLRQSVVWPTI
jgi:hypothetical protein